VSSKSPQSARTKKKTTGNARGRRRRARGGARARRRRSARGAGGLYFLAGALALVALAGILTVKFFETPRGRAVLLDRGHTDYYAQVQDDVGMAMHRALSRFHLDGRITETVRGARQDGAGYPLNWRIPCGGQIDLLRVNGALTDAIRSVGGRVRHGEERDDGRTVELRVGTRRFETHRVLLLGGVGSPPLARSRRQNAKASGKRPDGGHRGGNGNDARGSAHAHRRRVGRDGTGDGRPRVAIVIDDLGYARGGVVGRLLDLKLPLSVAILPSLPHSQDVLRRARREGRCTLLHLPLQAVTPEPFDVRPITVDMTAAAIESTVGQYLDELKGVDGVNNHQGSLATTDRRVMRAVLAPVRARHLFFLDSLTSPRSVAYNTAESFGIPAARNSIFLDDDTSDPDVVSERIRHLVDTARRNGSAIGIGHPHRWTLDALEASADYLRGSGVDLVPVCSLVR